MFADLHCHAHMRSFLTMCANQDNMKRRKLFHPWTIVATNMNRLKHSDRAIGYAQSDMVALWNGNVRLVFNSMYPIELGFFKKLSYEQQDQSSFWDKMIQFSLSHRSPLRKLIQHLTMRIPVRTIDYILSDEYDYWSFLQDEYAFLCAKDNEKTTNEIITLGFARKILESNKRRRKKYPDQYQATGKYIIPKNKKDILKNMSKDVIIMPLTIEGSHVFSVGDVSELNMLERIDHIKNEWDHPLFFITFAHHFYNGLCGHAHSMPGITDVLVDQSHGMNQGFTDIGWRMIRKFLSLDEQNNRVDTESYRILIDVKHMSAKSRMEYYEQIIKPTLAKGDVIPVIASHCAYSGQDRLQDLIDALEHENDQYRLIKEESPYYAWNINLCNEDIEMIYQTGGLFGISFDKRMLGMSADKRVEKSEKINSILAVWNQVKAILKVIYDNPMYSMDEKKKAWDIISIGTDFDGYIDPLSSYKTANELHQFKTDLTLYIQAMVDTTDMDILYHIDEDFTVEMAVEKICYVNAIDFLLKHYPDKK